MIKVSTTRTRSNSVALEALADTHVIEIPHADYPSVIVFIQCVLGENFKEKNFTTEEGFDLSALQRDSDNIIVHIKTGLRFLIPA